MIRRAVLAAVFLAALAEAASAATPLTMLVDEDGTAYLWNTFHSRVRFSGYGLNSTVNGLDPTAWKTVGESFAENPQAVKAVLGFELTTTSEPQRADHWLLETLNIAHLWPGEKFAIGKPFRSLPPGPTETAYFRPDILTVDAPMDIVYAPEPSTFLLAALAGIGLLALRLRERAESLRPL